MSDNPQAPERPPLTKQEMGERLIAAEITPAQYLGLPQERLYEIAKLGHQMLVRGQLNQALEIFEGLVAASPYDAVFHCNLAAVYLNLQRFQEAMDQFNLALQYNIANVDAFVGRSELYLREGKVQEALKDIQSALKLDPEAKRDTTKRARVMLMTLEKMANSAVEAEKK